MQYTKKKASERENSIRSLYVLDYFFGNVGILVPFILTPRIVAPRTSAPIRTGPVHLRMFNRNSLCSELTSAILSATSIILLAI